jgi:hypothetical protein
MKIFIGGVAALVVGIILLIFWWWDFITMVKGLIPVILLVGGGFAAYSGYDEIKEKMAGEPEEFEPTFDTTTAETTAKFSETAAGTAEEEKPAKPRPARTPRRRRSKKKEA